MKLPIDYYQSNDVVALAKDLLGKILITNVQNVITGGIITETEAYAGINDHASHTFGNLRTRRTEVLYSRGGTGYVYLCYGVHNLFNVVTGKLNNPCAVLIRGIHPIIGIETMLKRSAKSKSGFPILNGPGKLTKALGITLQHNGSSLTGKLIWIEDRRIKINSTDIQATKRIGIDYAGADALLLYRFFLNYKTLL